MNRTAYLVGVIDIKATPPKYLGSGIFSEPGPTVRGFPFVIVQIDADDGVDAPFENAVEKLKKLIETHHAYRWAKPLERK